MNIRKISDFEIYTISYELALQLYRLTETFPKAETYNITVQIRRSAVVIPSHIAAGLMKQSESDFIHSLKYSYSAAKELQVLLSLSKDLGYIPEQIYSQISKTVDAIAAKLVIYLKDAEKKAPANYYEEAKEHILADD